MKVQQKIIPAAILLFYCLSFAQAEQELGRISLEKAVQLTLQNDRDIALAKKEVEKAAASIHVASAKFDPLLKAKAEMGQLNSPLDSLSQQSLGKNTLRIFSEKISLSYGKLMRSGKQIQFQLALDREKIQNFSLPVSNTATLSLNLLQPLQRGKKKEAVTAREEAEKKLLEASIKKLNHISAQKILRTLQTYWDLVQAKEALAVLSNSETRAIELQEKIKVLIAHKEMPKASLNQVLADVAIKSTSRLEAEEALFRAKEKLIEAMGLSTDVDTLDAEDTFPALINQELKKEKEPSPSIHQALTARSDLEALILEEEAEKTLLVEANDKLKPQLDLVIDAGIMGGKQGSGHENLIGSFSDSDLNVLASLAFVKPLKNAEAKGSLQIQTARLKIKEIEIEELKRMISLNLSLASEFFAFARERLKHARNAVDQYQVAVENEKEKLKLGISTLIDVITVEDQLTRALLKQLGAAGDLARAIAEIRYQSGRLFPAGVPGEDLTFEHFTTVPTLKSE